MDRTRLSIDSLGESEVERLQDALRQKDAIINDKSEIIKSLRQQVSDMREELEETEKSQQTLYQKIDRLTKEIEGKNEHLEAITHSLQEIEKAHDNLSSKYEARVGQVKQLFDDLKSTKKELEKVQHKNEELQHNNERLSVELEMANTKKRVWMVEEQERLRRLKTPEVCVKDSVPEYNAPNMNQQRQQQNLHNRHHHHHHHRSQQQPSYDRVPEAENCPEIASALHFPMADEIGEIMDSSNALPLTPSTVGRSRRQPTQAALSTTTKPYRVLNEIQHISSDASARQQQTKQQVSSNDEHVNRTADLYDFANQNSPRSFDHLQAEVISRNNNNNGLQRYCSNHKPKIIEEQKAIDPIEEYKMRVARANELARRNKLTKPLHQTSYALELDTFDTTNLTEHEIKRGNVAGAISNANHHGPAEIVRAELQRASNRSNGQDVYIKHHESQPHRSGSGQARRVLADKLNTTPVARRAYKKAEAFVVT